jgi:branched-chain amino acid transport system substrate-binding protein
MTGRSRKLLLSAGVTLALATSVVPGAVAQSPSAGGAVGGGTIKIGGGFALTGVESALDVPAANGATLALEELNAADGIAGSQIEMPVHDSQYDMAVTAQVAQQYVEDDQVQAFIGYTDTDSVLASGRFFQDAGIPYITVGATSPKIPEQVGDMLFLAAFGDNVQAAAGAEYAKANFGDKAYLLLDNGVEYTRLLADYFKDAFTTAGGTIVLEDSHETDATDFSSQITKLRALPEQPSFYYIAAMPYNVGPVVKQLRDAGLTGPVVGGDGYDTPDLLAVAGPAAENVFFTTHALMDAEGGTEPIKAFITAYTERFGHAPENAFAALGYDTMKLMADAILRAGSTDGQAIKAAIEATSEFPGITGPISYTPEQHVPQKGVTLIAVKDGAFTLGAEIVPTYIPAP